MFKSTIVNGVGIGSCDYADLCALIKSLFSDTFNPNGACSDYPSLNAHGIDCICPFNLQAGLLDLQDISFPILDMSTTVFSFLASGDFDVKVNASDAQGAIANIQFKFTMKKIS